MENIIILVLAFLIAITIHEAAHAWVSYRLGDPTAKLMGRISLNPISHMDLYGTVLFPLFLILIRSPFIIGWAKPVQFDPYNLKNPRRDTALISLAGPASNLLLALLLSFILRLLQNPFSLSFILVNNILPTIIYLNVLLAIFNLLPIHPLDGGKILVGVLPKKDAYELDKFLRKYGMFILFFLIFPSIRGVSPISFILSPILKFILGLLIPAANYI